MRRMRIGLPLAIVLIIGLSLGLVAGGYLKSDGRPGKSEVPEDVDVSSNESRDQVDLDSGEILTRDLDWCADHSVPESECTLCHPELIPRFKEANDWCAEHDFPESHCRICNPGIAFPQEEALKTESAELTEDEIEISLHFRPNASACATDGAVIRLASAATAERTGISVQTVRTAQRELIIEAPAEIVFDETRTAVVTSTVPALLTRWLVSPGDMVGEGEVLAFLKSPEITQLRSALVTARAGYELERKELERHTEMRKRALISEADYDQQCVRAERAGAEVASAEGLLLSAGLDESDIEEISAHGSQSGQFVLRAPASGVVIDRIARPGQLLEAGEAYAILGNPTSMWIEARLTDRQMRNVDIGHQLAFSSDGKGINGVGGEVIWVSRFLDRHTRTGTVRARVLDPDHRLHAGEFGRARIVQRFDSDVALVPKDAVQWEGCCNVVFVRETVDRYRPRKVQVLDGDGPYYQVADGLRAGEEVVVDGAFLLKTELKKSSIGAGCCGLDPVG